MIRAMILGAAFITLGIEGVLAQDIAGIEDCTRTSGLDKRTGCLQSNINFLQRLVTRNQLDAAQQLKAAEAEMAALKATVITLQKAVEQLQAAQKTGRERAPQAK